MNYEKLSSDRLGENSALIREQVCQAMSQLGLSTQGYHRVLKLARAIAVLSPDPAIKFKKALRVPDFL